MSPERTVIIIIIKVSTVILISNVELFHIGSLIINKVNLAEYKNNLDSY